CGNILIHETCLKCNSRAGNSFPYDPIPESFNEVQIIPNPPPQSHFNIYLCQICEGNSHYGYECSQRILLVYEPEPCYNQSFSDNAYTHDSPSVTPLIDHHCCYNCGDSLNDFFCHQCTCEFCGNGAHDGYNCPLHVPFIQTLPSFPQQYPCCKDSIAITFDLPTVETKDSLRMGDEHLDTILAMESDEFIKFSVENLVPSPCKSEDLSDSECDIDFLLDEFSGELILLKRIPSRIDETDCDPEEEIHLIEKLFNSFMEEIDLSFTPDDPMPPGIEEDDYDSERDMLIFEELLSNDSFSTPKNELFHFDITSFPRPPAKPPNDDSKILTVKVVGDISKQYVMPRLLPTQPTLVSNQEKTPHHLSHWGFKASQLHSECPMMIYKGNTPILDIPFLYFYPH
nr:hypothetical protein [Tanacetum cinerariifolium]